MIMRMLVVMLVLIKIMLAVPRFRRWRYGYTSQLLLALIWLREQLGIGLSISSKGRHPAGGSVVAIALFSPWAAIALFSPWAAIALFSPWTAIALFSPWAILTISKRLVAVQRYKLWSILPLGVSQHGKNHKFGNFSFISDRKTSVNRIYCMVCFLVFHLRYRILL